MASMGPTGFNRLLATKFGNLEKSITIEEVRQAVCDCYGLKAPRPDKIDGLYFVVGHIILFYNAKKNYSSAVIVYKKKTHKPISSKYN